ncbi:hypothetical protein [Trujillonella humicola]|uniref:hypothetical protein n=1 Tax=Trujillonella humicola TaxID=3383699 RepID=UPI003906343C
MSDLTVQAERLPGIGWRYTVPAERNRQLVILVEDRGARHLVLVDPELDRPLMTVRLSGADAAVVAALLTGVRFRVATAEGEPAGAAADPAEVVVETVHVASGSPVVGLPQHDVVPRLGPDATLLGVIDDETPELVEDDGARGIRVGDKLVVAARRSQLDSLRSAL